MTTWTMQQVAQVRGLRAEVVVDTELVARYGETVLDEVAAEMAKRIMHMAHTFGVDVDLSHRDDFQVVWDKSEATPWQANGRLRWSPSTNVVELRGGHLDGQRLAVQKVGDSFRVPRPPTPPWDGDVGEVPTSALVELADTYEISGWREDEHVWVYEAR